MRTLTHAPLALLGLFCATALHAQPAQPTTTTMTAVPRLVRVNSSFHPANGSAPAALESATLAIYAEETGGTALWQETQNVSVDSDGHYSVLLGSTSAQGAAPPHLVSGIRSFPRADKRHSARFCAHVGVYGAGEPEIPGVGIGTVTQS